MKKFMNFLRKHSKKFAVVGVVSVAAISAGLVSSWGPERPTYTVENPADHVTFNSITNNPNVGDERNFVVVKDAANTNDGGWQDSVTVQPGKEYLVRVYVHNNAADNLNLKAINTRVSATVPTTTGKNIPVSGFVSADNATPAKIWDDISFNSTENFNLAYVAGSARIYNNGYAAGGNGQPLADSIVTASGALIGYNGANGEVPGCFKYANYVYFKVKPQFAPTPNFEVAKTVSKHGANQWVENVDVNAGDSVDFRIRYKNTGGTQQNNVVVKDKLPAHMSYVAGSTKLYNALNPNGKALSDNVTTATGVNIGSHSAGASSFVVFTAKVNAADTLPLCGPNVLKNIARVETDNGSKEDDATVKVPKECEQPEPEYECTALTAKALKPFEKREFEFTTKTRVANGASVNKYVYNFDDNTEALNTTNATVKHTFAKPGEYNISVKVFFNVNSTTVKEVADARCKVKLTITEKPCPYNPELPKDSPKCYVPCVHNPKLPKDSPKCVEKPHIPKTPITVIPSTGPVEVVAGIFGTSATAYGVLSLIESRRALKNVR